jgi:hypothetical protein
MAATRARYERSDRQIEVPGNHPPCEVKEFGVPIEVP